MDRAGATPDRCGEVEGALFDLFAALGASEEQLDFTVLYASAREVCFQGLGFCACLPRLGPARSSRTFTVLYVLALEVGNQGEITSSSSLLDVPRENLQHTHIAAS